MKFFGRINKTVCLSLLAGLVGGMLGALIMTPKPLEAAKNSGSFNEMTVYNSGGKRVGMMSPLQQGQGSIFLFDPGGQVTHQMASYGSGSEAGQSLIGMHDRNGALRFLFRLHGPKDSPTIVMKDDAGMDRMIIGLDGSTQQPYIRYMNSKLQLVDLIQ